MPITTTWTFDGTDLNNYAWKIMEMPESIPERRGGNVLVPGSRGRLYAPKYHDERSLVLRMYVNNKPTTGGARAQTNLLTNMQSLQKLFGAPGRKTLEKALVDASVIQIQAEVVEFVEFSHAAFNQYIFTLEFLLAESVWKPATTIEVSANIASDSQDVVVDTLGTAPVVDAEIKIYQTAENVRLTNITHDENYFEFDGTIASTFRLEVDCGDWQALRYGTTTASTNVTDRIIHAGESYWLRLLAGSNTIRVTSEVFTTAGSVVFTFRPAYY